jgi:hypothetical protein
VRQFPAVKRWLAIGGAVVAIAAILVVIGVGGDSPPTEPSSTVAEAAAATGKLRGFKIAIDGSVRVPQSDTEIPMKGSGVIDTRGGTAQLTMTMSGLPNFPGGKMKLDEVLSDYVMYVRSAAFEDKLPGGKQWLKVDLRKASQQFGVDPSQMTSDPTKALDQLRAVSGRVERLGREKVRGVQTTHYRAKVDLRRYPALVPADRREQVRKGMERLISMIGKSEFPQEVWIDAQKHIRRFAMDFSFKVPTAPGSPEVETKIVEDLYDFGTPVHVTVPSDDDAYDGTNLAQQGAPGAFPGQ